MEKGYRIKYRVRIHPRFLPSAKITPVKVDDRETEKFIFIDGKRIYKETGFLCFMDSFKEAKELLLKKAKIRVIDAQMELDKAHECFCLIEGLKEDEG